MVKKKHRLMVAWCIIALLICAAIVFIGAKILVKDTTGEDFLLQRQSEFHSKGTWQDERIPYIGFHKSDNIGLTTNVQGYFVNNTIYFTFPAGTNLNALRCRYETASGDNLFFNGAAVKKRKTKLDFSSQELFLTLGEERFEIKCLETALPVLSINTYENEPVFSRDFYVTGEAELYNESGNMELSMPVSARVRGNTTSTMPKLPYKIESNINTSILGLPKTDEWLLLANFFDPSMIRNNITFDMARELNIEYVPEFRYVELYLRGQYMGVYAIGTKVALSEVSVNLPPLNKEKGEWNGSYILEFDARLPEDWQGVYKSKFGLTFSVKAPKNYDDEMLEKMLEDLFEFEECLLEDNLSKNGVRYTEYIDVESFAKNYLIHEISGNGEAAMPFSIFLYRDKNEKLSMGPVWDFDLAYSGETEQLILNNAYWFKYLWEDEEFKQEVIKAYAQLAPFIDNFSKNIDLYASLLKKASVNNFIYTYIGVNDYSNTPADDPYDDEVKQLKEWAALHFEFLNSLFY